MGYSLSTLYSQCVRCAHGEYAVLTISTDHVIARVEHVITNVAIADVIAVEDRVIAIAERVITRISCVADYSKKYHAKD